MLLKTKYCLEKARLVILDISMQNSNNKKLFKVYRSPIQGRGLLALTDIPKETRIIEYVGEKITKAEAIRRIEKRGSKAPILVFELNQRYDIDGNVPGNPGKYINHSFIEKSYIILE